MVELGHEGGEAEQRDPSAPEDQRRDQDVPLRG
jgi:hypothetical protein